MCFKWVCRWDIFINFSVELRVISFNMISSDEVECEEVEFDFFEFF